MALIVRYLCYILICKYCWLLCLSESCDTNECPPGHKCEIVSWTGEPFCNPTCSVDNGGCDPVFQHCHEHLIEDCYDISAPCRDFVECSYKGHFDIYLPTQSLAYACSSDRFCCISCNFEGYIIFKNDIVCKVTYFINTKLKFSLHAWLWADFSPTNL